MNDIITGFTSDESEAQQRPPHHQDPVWRAHHGLPNLPQWEGAEPSPILRSIPTPYDPRFDIGLDVDWI